MEIKHYHPMQPLINLMIACHSMILDKFKSEEKLHQIKQCVQTIILLIKMTLYLMTSHISRITIFQTRYHHQLLLWMMIKHTENQIETYRMMEKKMLYRPIKLAQLD